MNEELKPCPFCSGTTEDQWHPRAAMFAGGPLKDSILHSIRCRGCGASTQIYDTLENAIVAWNTRPAEKTELDYKRLVEFMTMVKDGAWITEEAPVMIGCIETYAKAICARFRPAGTNKLVEALHHIIEYWNQDENENAMADALWHIIDTARQALAEHEAEKGKA